MNNKNGKNKTKWKIGSAVLIISAMLVLIVVLAVAGLALWMGALRNDPKNAVAGFSCSFRIVRGERYNPMLKLNTSMVFREKERKYKNLFELLFRRSVLGSAYKNTIIDKFENGTLRVFFRLYLDRRKIPKSITNVEDAITDILAKETYSTSSLFKNVELDLTSISVKKLGQEPIPNPKQQQRQSVQKNNAMITKNGLLRPGVRNDSITVSTVSAVKKPATSRPTAKIEPDEADIDFSNIPTIRGTYKVIKMNESTTRKSERTGSTPEPIKSDAKNEEAKSTTRIEQIASTTTRRPERIVNQTRNSTPSFASNIGTLKTTEKPFKDFVDPEFETSPWKPIVPDFVNTELRLILNQRSNLTNVGNEDEEAVGKENRAPDSGLNLKRSNNSERVVIPVAEDRIAEKPGSLIEGERNPGGFNPEDKEVGIRMDGNRGDLPQDRIVPEEMVNFRVNGKFKNKIPASEVEGEEPFRDGVVNLGFQNSKNPAALDIVQVETAPPAIQKTYNVHVSSSGNFQPSTTGKTDLQNAFTQLPATVETRYFINDRKSSTSVPEISEIPGIEGIGEAEVVLDETELESRNRFSEIEALEDVMQDRKALPEKEPVYTSYKSQDLNGEAKPSLVENPGTLRPFRHTIPVDKITSLISAPILAEEIKEGGIYSEEEPSGTTTTFKPGHDTELVTEISIFSSVKNSKIELADDRASTEPRFPGVFIDDEKPLTDQTTEIYAEMIHPVNNNAEKLTLADNIRNSTFVEIDTVKHTPGVESLDFPADSGPERETESKIYNDTLRANVVENLVTLAPAKSNSGVGRPIRPRPKIGAEKTGELLEEEENIEVSENDEIRGGEAVMNLEESSGTEEIVEVITSISTKISSSADEESNIEENRGGESPEVISRGEINRPLSETGDSKISSNSDRKISSDQESMMLLEKLKQFAKVRTDSLTISTKPEDPVKPETKRPEVDENFQTFANINELSKIAALSTGDKFEPRNDTADYTFSRDGIKILTKVLTKSEERTEKMRSSTEENEGFKNSETCQGFLCNDGKCLPAGARCNMLRECSTSEDESNCKCADFLKAQLLYHKICDGTPDCWDYSDETDCEWCSEGQYVCGNSRACINPEKVCDGYRDCPGGEDEKKCAALIDDYSSVNGSNDLTNVDKKFAKDKREDSESGEGFLEAQKTGDQNSGNFDKTDKETVESSVLETTTFRIVVSSENGGSKNAKSEREMGSKKEEEEEEGGEEEEVAVSGREITPDKKPDSVENNSFNTGEKSSDSYKTFSDVRRNEIDDYNNKGFLSVRKNGKWGKLCLTGIDNLLERKKTIWTIEDLGRAVCKAITYQDYEKVEKVRLERSRMSQDHYYSLVYNEKSSDKASLTFKSSSCPTGEVLKVKCKNLECGVRTQTPTQARIVGGGSSTSGSWPWQVALYKEGDYQCGGALINDKFILSAAHCFYHAQNEYWVARMGTTRRGNFPSPHEQLVRVEKISLHPDYVDNGFINDIALLKLEQSASFSDYVRPVCLPKTEPKEGEMCKVTGWGQLFEVGRVFPDTLQEVELPVISTEECRRRTLFLPLYKITSGMLCAGLKDGGRDACLGDSGGPLVCPESNNKYTLQGITSNGYGCARPGRPGVYTKVHHYVPWIEDVTSKDELSSSESICKGHRCPLGECLPKSRVCNGYLECSDGSDERDCPIY